jgi:general secretion pathway protein H
MRCRGFTLIEILVVMVLISIILSMAVISLGNHRERELREEIVRLQQLIQLAQDESILNQRPLAIKFLENGYRFEFQERVEDERIWKTITTPDVLRERSLEQEMEIILRQDGLPVSLENEDSGRIVILSSGEMTPFELEMGWPDDEITRLMTASPYGELVIKGEERDLDESA